MILAAVALAAALPAPDAEALGRQLAESGTLATLLPIMAAKETEEMVAAHPELSDAEKIALRETARETADAGKARIMAEMGRAYAAKLGLADLQALVAFNGSEAAKRYRAVTPEVMVSTMTSLGSIDFKGETMAAFCGKTGKGCPAK